MNDLLKKYIPPDKVEIFDKYYSLYFDSTSQLSKSIFSQSRHRIFLSEARAELLCSEVDFKNALRFAFLDPMVRNYHSKWGDFFPLMELIDDVVENIDLFAHYIFLFDFHIYTDCILEKSPKITHSKIRKIAFSYLNEDSSFIKEHLYEIMVTLSFAFEKMDYNLYKELYEWCLSSKNEEILESMDSFFPDLV